MAILHETLGCGAQRLYTVAQGEPMSHFKSLVRAWLMIAACAAPLAACAAEPKGVGVAPPARIPDVVDPPLNRPHDRISTAAVPAVIRRLVAADAAAHLRVSENSVVLSRADRVVWSDAALGCPQPGMGYVQAVEPGYRIVVRTAETELVYHTNERTDAAASIIRCDAARPRPGAKPATPPPADDSQPRTLPPGQRTPDR
jgi:hypothetical protein